MKNILAWNPGAERLYGWREAEALGMNVRDMIPTEQRDENIVRVRQLVQAGRLEPYRTRRINKDGLVLEIWLIASALMNNDGRVYAIATTER